MSDLQARPLGELIQIRKGKKPASVSPRQQNEAQRPYLLIDSFGGNYKSFTDDTSCPYAKADETLLVWDGERCGLTSTGHEGYIGSTLSAICTTNENLEPNYLFHFLVSKQKEIRNSAEGTGVPHVSRRSLEDLEIVIPPLPEQKKIAEILSGIDREIESLSKAIDLHRKTRNALIESIFEDGHKKAENGSNEWQVWSIEDLLASTATPMRSGPFGSALRKEELAKEGIPFLGIDNVRTEEFVLNFKRFLTDEKFKELRRYEVFPQDVMITIMGTVGRSCVVPEGIGPCVSSKHTWTMTFDHSKVAPEIVCWHLNHYGRTRTKFLESSQGGVMDAISSLTLRETKVPIPTSRVFAEQIVGHYNSSHNHEQALNDKFRKIKLLKNAVSSDLLSGRKRVNDARVLEGVGI